MTRRARLPLRATFPPPLPAGQAGDPGVVGPGVFADLWGSRLVLFGGPAAILLQVAHPRVAAGVAGYSDYRTRPGHRLVVTLQATLAVTFGDTAQARGAARRVGRRHVDVPGASDPDLARWVYATLLWTALRVHTRYGTKIGDDQREDYLRESLPFAAMFGVAPDSVPPTWAEFTAYVADTARTVAVGPEAREIAIDLLQPRLRPPLPGLGLLLRAVSADLLPEPLRVAYDLPLTRRRRVAVAVFAAAVRWGLPRSPLRLQEFPHVRVAAARRAQQDGQHDSDGRAASAAGTVG